jgi:hypothetical protein
MFDEDPILIIFLLHNLLRIARDSDFFEKKDSTK